MPNTEYINNLLSQIDILKNENRIYKEKQYSDTLTKLPNRLAYERDIINIKEPKIIVLELDSFQDINIHYGYEVGGKVLQEVTKMVLNYAKKKDMTVYKICFNEFLFVDEGDLDIERFERISVELVELIKNKDIVFGEYGQTITVNATMGFSLETKNSLNKALIALAYARENQRDFACYLHRMSDEDVYSYNAKYLHVIQEALKNDKVMPFYQPIFNRSKEIEKYEVLIRIEDEDGEIVSPFKFLQTSRQVKLYSQITKTLVNKCFSKITNTNTKISINLLARDMMDGDINNYILKKAKEKKVSKQIIFEILEDESIEDEIRIENFFKRAKRLGIKLAIDDFGTGYSNFSYLMKIKPDYLKIDGSIVKNLGEDKNSEAIIKAIISFAKTLGMKTIAEFVHSKEVYDICYEIGIDEFQGFYLGEPAPELID